MSYNPYNPYGNYNPYGMNYQQPNMYQQPMAQPQYQPQYSTMQNVPPQNLSNNMNMSGNYQPTFVNGVEGARAYILMPNQIMYLKDSDNENIIYIKKADNEGKCTLNVYKMNEISIDDVGKKQETTIGNEQPKIDYLTRSDFNAFLGTFDSRMNDLSTLVEKSLQKPNRYVKNENMQRSDR